MDDFNYVFGRENSAFILIHLTNFYTFGGTGWGETEL